LLKWAIFFFFLTRSDVIRCQESGVVCIIQRPKPGQVLFYLHFPLIGSIFSPCHHFKRPIHPHTLCNILLLRVRAPLYRGGPARSINYRRRWSQQIAGVNCCERCPFIPLQLFSSHFLQTAVASRYNSVLYFI
jgi:hypothetical protein